MAATLNLHRVFAGRGGYLEKLRVGADDVELLRTAREEIRQTLRTAFRDWENYVTRVELFDSWLMKAALDLPAPKFRIQGSFAYHTANDCQVTPPQQIDQDDGVFLPISFLTTNGSSRPSIVSKAYFRLVEQALTPLCRARGWRLNPGKPKNTCVRIEVSSRLHIDLPLYAIRDDAYNRLVESALARMDKSFAADEANQTELVEEVYKGLEQAEIMVAHREKGWLESDPRRLEDWFTNALALYGEQLRRVCRAYKGLRDAKWSEPELSSICIMAAVVTAYERLGGLDPDRDDVALMQTSRELAKLFAAPIENPVFPGEADKCLCGGWTEEFRREVCSTFEDTADALQRAIEVTMHKGVALDHARGAFGPRIPDDIDLISVVGAVATIRQTQPTPQPKPLPPRTRSG
jgi:hypothetical protein